MEKTFFFLRKKVFLVLLGHLWAFTPMLAALPDLGTAGLGDHSQSPAIQMTVTGTVSDGNGTPLPGVSVVERGTTNGVATDFDGNYEIRVSSAESILDFTYLGFTSASRTVGANGTINITLEESTSLLDEVVVIGYGTTRKSDLTGSVVTVSGTELSNVPVATAAEAMTGRLAGVQIVATEGSPDAEVNIRVRGGGSLTQDSSPLLIVDGFPVNSINDISPSDIESITVLKDASSTAIYGSRGANGVVIITTKSGKDGKISVSVNSFYGMKQIANTIDVLDPADFVAWQYEYAMMRNSEDLSSYENFFGGYGDIDQYNGLIGNNWQKQVYGRTGEIHSQDLAVRGGTEKFNYNFNYARYDEKAIQIGSEFLRNNLSLKLNNKVNDKIDLAFTIRYSDTEIEGGGANEQNEASSADSRLKHSVGYSPIPLAGISTSDTDEYSSSKLIDPFVATADNDRLQLRKNYNTLGSFSWKIFDNVRLKSDLGLDDYSYQDYRFYGRQTYYVNNTPAPENQALPAIIMRDRRDKRFRTANTLDIDLGKYLNDDHRLKLLVGQEYILFERNEVTEVVHGLPRFFDFDQAKKLTTQGTPFAVDNFYSPDDKLLSFFTRVNYDLFDKYLFTATFRADASSKFLGDNRWGYFPSAAFAWKISEEGFLRNVNWMDALKLRLSYGQAGNENIPVGQTVQNFVSNTSAWINGVNSFWAASTIMANPDLKWETTVTRNIGLDFSLLRNRISGSLEVYRNNTEDLLLQFPVPGTGYQFQYRNMGENQNQGIEASLNLAILDKEDYGLDLSLNFSKNENEVISLGVMDNFTDRTNWASSEIHNEYQVMVGEPLGLMQGYRHDGRYEVSDFDFVGGEYVLRDGVADASAVLGNVPQPGSMKFRDLDGDGLVTDADMDLIGRALPKHTGGFVLSGRAYGFDLSAAFNYSYGNDVYNANKIEFTTANRNSQYRNLSSQMATGNRWTNIDPVSGALVTDPTQLAAMNANTTMWSPFMNNYVFSDWAVEDGSFLRLNTLTLGYSLPDDVVQKIGFTRLRIYTTGYNVALWTKYSGLDPEVSTRRRTPLTPGVDYSPYPRSRQFVLGVNLNF